MPRSLKSLPGETGANDYWFTRVLSYNGIVKEQKNMRNSFFDFDDIRLLPKKGIVASRDECDISVKLGKFTFKNPVIPANMISSINDDLCVKLAQSGYCYINHRFNHNNIDFIRSMNEKNLFTSISVGVKEDSFKQIDMIRSENLRVDIICVDLAHGHSIAMEKMVKYIRDAGLDSYIIGGNICTQEAVEDLTQWGCSAAKVGIGPGSACSTFTATHFGSKDWQASCILNLAQMSKIPIICDGGIRTPGHIAAALAMGATMCMVGGMLAGFEDSPGSIVERDGKLSKEFFGSASEFTKGHTRYSEGKKTLVEYKHGSLIHYLDTTINEGLRSAISYAGGNCLSALNHVDWLDLKWPPCIMVDEAPELSE